MLLVKTKLGLSDIHGVGVFAAEDIQVGTVVSKFVFGFDQMFVEGFVDRSPSMTPESLDFLRKHGYLSKGEVPEPLIDSKFVGNI